MSDDGDRLRELAVERARAILAESKAAADLRDARKRRKDVEGRIDRMMAEIATGPLPLFAGNEKPAPQVAAGDSLGSEPDPPGSELDAELAAGAAEGYAAKGWDPCRECSGQGCEACEHKGWVPPDWRSLPLDDLTRFGLSVECWGMLEANGIRDLGRLSDSIEAGTLAEDAPGLSEDQIDQVIDVRRKWKRWREWKPSDAPAPATPHSAESTNVESPPSDLAEFLMPGIADAIAENQAVKDRTESLLLKMAFNDAVPAATRSAMESGATDDQVRKALQSYWGLRDDCDEPRAGAGYVTRGGRRPAFWFGDAKPPENAISGRFRKPDVIGQALVDRVREAVGIPTPIAAVDYDAIEADVARARPKGRTGHYVVLHRPEPNRVVQLGEVEAMDDDHAKAVAKGKWIDVPSAQIEVRRYSGKPPKADRRARPPVADEPAWRGLAVTTLKVPGPTHGKLLDAGVKTLGELADTLAGTAYTDAALAKRWGITPLDLVDVRGDLVRLSGQAADEMPAFLVFKGSNRKPEYAIRAASLLDALRLAKGRAGKSYSPRVELDDSGRAKALGLESIYAPPADQVEAEKREGRPKRSRKAAAVGEARA